LLFELCCGITVTRAYHGHIQAQCCTVHLVVVRPRMGCPASD
jgi:hypothetical protein